MIPSNTNGSSGIGPRITIGVMTRNYARFLPHALNSIVSQDMADWEVVIADDASTDETAEIVRPYLSDPRITYVRHGKPLGQAGNWGFCLHWGTAPIVAVLHADDAYLPDTLSWAVHAFVGRPQLDLLYGNYIRTKNGVDSSGFARLVERIAWSCADGELPGPDAFLHLMAHNHTLPSSSFLRRSVLSKSGLPDTRLAMMVDVEFYRRVALASRRVAWTSRPITRYLEHIGSTTSESTHNGRLARELVRFSETLLQNIRRYGLDHEIDRSILLSELQAARRAHGTSLFAMGVSEAIGGNHSRAWQLMRLGLGMSPRQILELRSIIDGSLIILRQTWLLRRLHWKYVRGIPAYASPVTIQPVSNRDGLPSQLTTVSDAI